MAKNRAKLLSIGVRLIGPLLLGVVIWRVGDPGKLLAALAQANVGVLLVAALLNALNVQFKVLRWQMLLRTLGYRYGTRDAWRAMLPSSYIGMITPGRVGDVLRIQYLHHDIGVPRPEGLAVVVMDRFCDLYVLLGFVAAGFAHFTSVLTGELGYLTWGAVVITAVGPLLFLVRGPVDKILEPIYARISTDRSPEAVKRFLGSLRSQLGPRLFYAVPLTVGAFAVQYGQGWLAAGALGMRISVMDVTFLLAITSLLSLLPISLSGVGLREAFMALAFPAIGLSAEQGVAFGLVMFAVIYLAHIVAGFIAWQISPPPFGKSMTP